MAITTYGERSPHAPAELHLFSFLVGKWEGSGRTQLEGGKFADFELAWVGRYVLDGTAIADEFHSKLPDGNPYLGVSLRHFDPTQKSWIIEYINVTHSFLRRQVNAKSGSVRQEGGSVIVVCEDGETRIREYYDVVDPNKFTYRTDMSRDAGRTWDAPQIEMTLTRVN